MIKSTKMIDSTDEHLIIGDVLLHSHSELKPICIIVQTPSIISYEKNVDDESIPRIISSVSSRKTFVHKIDENYVKKSPNLFNQYSHLLKTLTAKKIQQLHQTSGSMVTKLKSKRTVISAVRKNFSNNYATCQITYF